MISVGQHPVVRCHSGSRLNFAVDEPLSRHDKRDLFVVHQPPPGFLCLGISAPPNARKGSGQGSEG
jgi:hypothetical protein